MRAWVSLDRWYSSEWFVGRTPPHWFVISLGKWSLSVRYKR